MLELLPPELLMAVADHLDFEADLNAMGKASRHLYDALEPYRYRRNARVATTGRFTSALHWAGRMDNVHVAKKAIDAGADVCLASIGGGSPLHAAVIGNSVDVTRLLLHDERVDIEAKTRTSITPLHLAAAYGHVAVGMILLEAGATVAVCAQGARDQELTPLRFAVMHGHLAFTKLLVSTGKIHQKIENEPDMSSPLRLAVERRDYSMAAYLLHSGIPDSQSRFSSEMRAMIDGHRDVMDLLERFRELSPPLVP
ncbi:hypothetical protein O9K51_06815 [Purpureocillium lavendulum]|uniref:Uncharacterized protein n=1 Tax=Purpureocillium lavendulum TaxID=1247861 RepID=A0AB34FQR9_9HYPO|nr:hypothetical protein O9K51_06815 [Purpureocillium lavendulum]